MEEYVLYAYAISTDSAYGLMSRVPFRSFDPPTLSNPVATASTITFSVSGASGTMSWVAYPTGSVYDAPTDGASLVSALPSSSLGADGVLLTAGNPITLTGFSSGTPYTLYTVCYVDADNTATPARQYNAVRAHEVTTLYATPFLTISDFTDTTLTLEAINAVAEATLLYAFVPASLPNGNAFDNVFDNTSVGLARVINTYPLATFTTLVDLGIVYDMLDGGLTRSTQVGGLTQATTYTLYVALCSNGGTAGQPADDIYSVLSTSSVQTLYSAPLVSVSDVTYTSDFSTASTFPMSVEVSNAESQSAYMYWGILLASSPAPVSYVDITQNPDGVQYASLYSAPVLIDANAGNVSFTLDVSLLRAGDYQLHVALGFRDVDSGSVVGYSSLQSESFSVLLDTPSLTLRIANRSATISASSHYLSSFPGDAEAVWSLFEGAVSVPTSPQDFIDNFANAGSFSGIAGAAASINLTGLILGSTYTLYAVVRDGTFLSGWATTTAESTLTAPILSLGTVEESAAHVSVVLPLTPSAGDALTWVLCLAGATPPVTAGDIDAIINTPSVYAKYVSDGSIFVPDEDSIMLAGLLPGVSYTLYAYYTTSGVASVPAALPVQPLYALPVLSVASTATETAFVIDSTPSVQVSAAVVDALSAVWIAYPLGTLPSTFPSTAEALLLLTTDVDVAYSGTADYVSSAPYAKGVLEDGSNQPALGEVFTVYVAWRSPCPHPDIATPSTPLYSSVATATVGALLANPTFDAPIFTSETSGSVAVNNDAAANTGDVRVVWILCSEDRDGTLIDPTPSDIFSLITADPAAGADVVTPNSGLSGVTISDGISLHGLTPLGQYDIFAFLSRRALDGTTTCSEVVSFNASYARTFAAPLPAYTPVISSLSGTAVRVMSPSSAPYAHPNAQVAWLVLHADHATPPQHAGELRAIIDSGSGVVESATYDPMLDYYAAFSDTFLAADMLSLSGGLVATEEYVLYAYAISTDSAYGLMSRVPFRSFDPPTLSNPVATASTITFSVSGASGTMSWVAYPTGSVYDVPTDGASLVSALSSSSLGADGVFLTAGNPITLTGFSSGTPYTLYTVCYVDADSTATPARQYNAVRARQISPLYATPVIDVSTVTDTTLTLEATNAVAEATLLYAFVPASLSAETILGTTAHSLADEINNNAGNLINLGVVYGTLDGGSTRSDSLTGFVHGTTYTLCAALYNDGGTAGQIVDDIFSAVSVSRVQMMYTLPTNVHFSSYLDNRDGRLHLESDITSGVDVLIAVFLGAPSVGDSVLDTNGNGEVSANELDGHVRGPSSIFTLLLSPADFKTEDKYVAFVFPGEEHTLYLALKKGDACSSVLTMPFIPPYTDPILVPVPSSTTNESAVVHVTNRYNTANDLTMYWAALPSGAAEPTREEIKNGSTLATLGSDHFAMGNIPFSAATAQKRTIEDYTFTPTETDVVINDLVSATDCKFYAFFESEDGLQSGVANVGFSTYALENPTVTTSALTDISASFSVSPGHDLSWVLLKDGYTGDGSTTFAAPTFPEELLDIFTTNTAGLPANAFRKGSVPSIVVPSVFIAIDSGLTPETAYTLYVVFGDATPVSNLTAYSFTTPASVVPPTLQVVGLTALSVRVEATNAHNAGGTLHWAIQSGGVNDAVGLADIQSNANIALGTASFSLPPSTQYIEVLSGLAPGLTYTLYTVLESNGIPSVVSPLSFTTLLSTPSLLVDARFVTTSEARVNVSTSDNVHVVWVLCRDGVGDHPTNANEVEAIINNPARPRVASSVDVNGTSVGDGISLSSLRAATSYSLYAFLKRSADGNVSVMVMQSIQTLYASPVVSITENNGALITVEIAFTPSGSRGLVYALLPDGTAPPMSASALDVVVGVGGTLMDRVGDIVHSSGDTLTMDVPIPGERYNLYVALKDSGVFSAVVVTPIQSLYGRPILGSAERVTHNAAIVAVENLNPDDLTLYWAVLSDGAMGALSPVQIKNGGNFVSGNVSMAASMQDASITADLVFTATEGYARIAGLMSNIDYRFYAFFESAEGVQSEVADTVFRTYTFPLPVIQTSTVTDVSVGVSVLAPPSSVDMIWALLDNSVIEDFVIDTTMALEAVVADTVTASTFSDVLRIGTTLSADLAGEITFANLFSATNYTLYAAFRDGSTPAMYSGVDSFPLMTESPVASPTLELVDVTSSDVFVTATNMHSAGGTLHWAVRLGDPDPAVSADDIQGAGNVSAGTVGILSSSPTQSIEVLSAFMSGQSYTFYAVLEAGSIFSVARALKFTTLLDPPVLAVVMDSVTASTTSLNVMASADRLQVVWVLYEGVVVAAPANATEIVSAIAGTGNVATLVDSSADEYGTPVAAGISLSSLQSGTAYTLYAFVRNPEDDNVSAVVMHVVQTLYPTPVVTTNIAPDSLTMTVTFGIDGTRNGIWVLVPEGAPGPMMNGEGVSADSLDNFIRSQGDSYPGSTTQALQSGSEVVSPLTTPGGMYTLYLALKDANVYSKVISMPIRGLYYAPVLGDAEEITDGSAVVSVENNNPNALTVYWAAVPATTSTPTLSQIKDPSPLGVPFVRGSDQVQNVVGKDVLVSGLSSGLAWTFYAFFESADEVVSMAESTNFTTLAFVAPALVLDASTSNSASVSLANAVEAPTVQWVLLPGSAPTDAPSSLDDFTKLLNDSSVMSSTPLGISTAGDIVLSGLSPVSFYVLYAVFVDGAMHSAVSSLSFSTISSVAISSPTLNNFAATSSGMVVTITNTMDIAVDLYWVLLPADSSVSGAADIKARVLNNDSFSGKFPMEAVGDQVKNISGLSAGEGYAFYVIFFSAGDFSAVVSVPFYTLLPLPILTVDAASLSTRTAQVQVDVTSASAPLHVVWVLCRNDADNHPINASDIEAIINSLASPSPMPRVASSADVYGTPVMDGIFIDVLRPGIPYTLYAFVRAGTESRSAVVAQNVQALYEAPQVHAISSITNESAVVRVENTNTTALTLYWVAIPSDLPAPVAVQIESPSTLSSQLGGALVVGGSVGVNDHTTEEVSLTALAANTQTTFYAFFKSVSEVSSSVVSEDFSTLSLVSPALSLSVEATDTSATVSVANEPSGAVALLWVLLEGVSPANAPSSATELKVLLTTLPTMFKSPVAGVDPSMDIALTALSPATMYTFYAAFEVGSETSGVGTLLFITTSPVAAPTLGEPTLTASSVSVSVTNTHTDTGDVYWTILQHGETLSRGDDILAKVTNNEPRSGVMSGLAAGAAQAVDVAVDLLPDTNYILYATTETNGVFSSLSLPTSFRTLLSTPSLRLDASSVTTEEAFVAVITSYVSVEAVWVLCTTGSENLPMHPSDIASIITNHGTTRVLPNSDNVAGSPASNGISLTGLAAAGDYTLYAFLKRNTGGRSAIVEASIRTQYAAPFMDYSLRTSNSATLDVVTAHDANVPMLWVLFPSYDANTPPMPTSASALRALITQLVAGTLTGVTDNPSLRSTPFGDTARQIMLSGLLPGTSYVLYAAFKLRDICSVVVSAPPLTTLDLVAMPETHDPVLTADGTTITSSSVDVRVENTYPESLTLHWVVLPAADPVPATDDIVLANALNGSVLVAGAANGANGTLDVSVLGLVPNTDYIFHAFFRSSGGIASEVVSTNTFTTTSPDDAGLSEPMLTIVPSSVTATSVTIRVANTADELVRLFWLVRTADASLPTISAIVEATVPNEGLEILTSGEVDSTVEVPVMGLEADTSYAFYALVKSSDLVISDMATITFTTLDASALSPDELAASDISVGVSISPNPVLEVLRMTSPSTGTLTVYSLSGALLGSYDVAAGVNAYSFFNYPSGTYLLHVVLADKQFVYRVMKH